MGPYFSHINSPWDIILLPHGLLLVAHGALIIFVLRAPKSYTAAGNMRSPGYVQAVFWISEEWAELDFSLIASSYQFCGTRNLADFSSQLRHFVRTTELFDEVQLADVVIDENQFSEYNEDGLYTEVDAIMDSESDQDEHED